LIVFNALSLSDAKTGKALMVGATPLLWLDEGVKTA
jgi:hypothetical protein